MKAKRTNKSNKKQSETTNSPHHLASFLLNKHQHEEEKGESTLSTAYLLETILSGSDQQLQTTLEEWGDLQSIESIVRGWGPSNTTTLFNRLLSLMHSGNQNWTFPWISGILRTNTNLPADSIGQLNGHLSNESGAPLLDILKLQGKLQFFDV